MSVLIASKYWIHYLSVPKEPPTEANGSRINWSEQSSLLPDTVLLLWHLHRIGEPDFETGLFLHCTSQSTTFLLPGFSDRQWHYYSLAAAAKYNTGLRWNLWRSSPTKGCLFVFKPNSNLWRWRCNLRLHGLTGNSHQERNLHHRNLERHLHPRLRNRSVIRTLAWDGEDLLSLWWFCTWLNNEPWAIEERIFHRHLWRLVDKNCVVS